MLAELERHPHARAVLEPVVAGSQASHAYLFYGPGGAGKRAAARAVAAELLSAGSADPAGARARVASGAHPDLTWVAPSGAHEILVSDIDEPVISAASKTPFEAGCRVFVIERVDELGEEAANRMLKTLEEPASFVHLILLSDRLAEVLPTIQSRCQLVRFDAPSVRETAAALEADGEDADAALACARLALGDGERARELSGPEGRALRAAAEAFARAASGFRGDGARPALDSVVGRGARAGGDIAGGARCSRTRGARAVSPQGAQANRDRVVGADPTWAPAGRDGRTRPGATGGGALVRRPRVSLPGALET